MCDTLTLCFFVWAVALWIDGLRQPSWTRLALASVLVAAAALSKYFALSLFPLLVAGTLIVGRPRQYLAIVWLAVPAALFAGYEYWTWRLYGVAHIAGASAFAAGVDRGVPLWAKTVIGLAFVGGAFLPIIFCAPFIFSKRVVALSVLAAAAVAVYTKEVALRTELSAIGVHRPATWDFAIQLGLFIGAGILVFALGVPSFRELGNDRALSVLSL